MEIKKIAEGAYFVPSYYMPRTESHVPGIVNQAIISGGTFQQEDTGIDDSPTKLENCEPGATKTQVFEALRIVATTEVKSKPDSKKPS